MTVYWLLTSILADVVPQPPNYSPYNDNWSNHSQLDTHRHSGNVRSSTTVTVDNTVEQSHAFSTSIHITQDGQEGREIWNKPSMIPLIKYPHIEHFVQSIFFNVCIFERGLIFIKFTSIAAIIGQ